MAPENIDRLNDFLTSWCTRGWIFLISLVLFSYFEVKPLHEVYADLIGPCPNITNNFKDEDTKVSKLSGKDSELDNK